MGEPSLRILCRAYDSSLPPKDASQAPVEITASLLDKAGTSHLGSGTPGLGCWVQWTKTVIRVRGMVSVTSRIRPDPCTLNDPKQQVSRAAVWCLHAPSHQPDSPRTGTVASALNPCALCGVSSHGTHRRGGGLWGPLGSPLQMGQGAVSRPLEHTQVLAWGSWEGHDSGLHEFRADAFFFLVHCQPPHPSLALKRTRKQHVTCGKEAFILSFLWAWGGDHRAHTPPWAPAEQGSQR